MPWPQRILDRLGGRAPIVGDWVMPCCIQDLRRVEDQEEIDAVLESIEDDFDDGSSWWPTLEDALRDLEASDGPHWEDYEREIAVRLRREECARWGVTVHEHDRSQEDKASGKLPRVNHFYRRSERVTEPHRFDVSIAAPVLASETLKPKFLFVAGEIFCYDKRGRLFLFGKSRSHSNKIFRERGQRLMGRLQEVPPAHE